MDMSAHFSEFLNYFSPVKNETVKKTKTGIKLPETKIQIPLFFAYLDEPFKEVPDSAITIQELNQYVTVSFPFYLHSNSQFRSCKRLQSRKSSNCVDQMARLIMFCANRKMNCVKMLVSWIWLGFVFYIIFLNFQFLDFECPKQDQQICSKSRLSHPNFCCYSTSRARRHNWMGSKSRDFWWLHWSRRMFEANRVGTFA